jgi:hypothetical protein
MTVGQRIATARGGYRPSLGIATGETIMMNTSGAKQVPRAERGADDA